MSSPSSSSSSPSPQLETDENLSTKPKRLPRSAKKRLRYERIRQQRKLTRKTKQTVKSTNNPAGKIVKREANERLAEINQDENTPVICIDCSYDNCMTKKVSGIRFVLFWFLYYPLENIGNGESRSSNRSML